MWADDIDARIDATAGLQMSQPVPLPHLAITPENVAIPVAATTWNSSARDWVKCSHRAFDCSTPCASSSRLSIGTQLPQDVPAAVTPLIAGTSHAPCEIAPQIAPLLTALQEQICASSGSAPRPTSVAAGAISDAGSAGSERATGGGRVPSAVGLPTRMPPNSVAASSETTSFAYVPFVGSFSTTSSAPSVVAWASPKLATSTPSSLSLVDMSAPGKSAVPTSSRSATTSAVA